MLAMNLLTCHNKGKWYLWLGPLNLGILLLLPKKKNSWKRKSRLMEHDVTMGDLGAQKRKDNDSRFLDEFCGNDSKKMCVNFREVEVSVLPDSSTSFEEYVSSPFNLKLAADEASAVRE